MFLLLYSFAVLIPLMILMFSMRKKVSIKYLLPYGIMIYLVGLGGSRLLSFLETNRLQDFTMDVLFNDDYGLTIYGGYISIFLVSLPFIKMLSNSETTFYKNLSLCVILFHLGYAIGRLGCHFSADGCYGKVTFSQWGIRYTWGEHQTLFPVYPTSVYETILNGFIALLFLFAFYRKKFKTVVFVSFFIFPFSRFLIEYIRVNPIVYKGYTLNQLLSIALIFIHYSYLYFVLKTKIISYEKNNLGINSPAYS